MYHHVGPFRRGTYRNLNVSARHFERQMRWLAQHGYAGIRPSQWLAWFKHGVALPARPVIVTFDDAYADIAEFALPILHRYGFAGCVFVATGFIGKTNAWDEAEGCGTLRVMNAEQIRHWAGQGIEFGAHSRTHVDLTALTGARLREEVATSKDELEAIMESPVSSFAYPYGASNEAVRAEVQARFGLGFGTEEGANYRSTNPHMLKRIYVGPNDLLIEFGLIVRWGGRQPVRATGADDGPGPPQRPPGRPGFKGGDQGFRLR